MGTGRKRILTLAVAALLLVSLPLAVYAYLSAGSGQISNLFNPAPEKDPTIQESFNGTVKNNVFVSVGETGYRVYVRAAILITWKDDKGDVHAEKPVAGTDYEMTLNSVDWFEHEGFYYCKASVASGDNSHILINTCKQLDQGPAGYKLSVEILAQTIQVAGTTDGGNVPAVTDAWGVKIADGLLVKP